MKVLCLPSCSLSTKTQFCTHKKSLKIQHWHFISFSSLHLSTHASRVGSHWLHFFTIHSPSFSIKCDFGAIPAYPHKHIRTRGRSHQTFNQESNLLPPHWTSTNTHTHTRRATNYPKNSCTSAVWSGLPLCACELYIARRLLVGSHFFLLLFVAAVELRTRVRLTGKTILGLLKTQLRTTMFIWINVCGRVRVCMLCCDRDHSSRKAL